MVMSRETIVQTLQNNREKIRKFGVKRLGLFGSFARNQATQTSDLDFLVEFDKKSFDDYMDLKMFLEQLFSCRVDLVLMNTIKPRLRKNILEETIYAPGL